MTDTTQQIPEIEIFALLGQKDCEILMKDRMIEQLKKMLVDLDSTKKQNIELVESNKALSDQCIKLDKELTDARLELSQTVVELETSVSTLLNSASSKIGELNVKHNKGKKRNEADALPTLEAGELAVTTDTHEFFFGDGAANHGVVLTDGLKVDWDIGNARMIQADKIRARDGDGLALYEDGGAGIFIKDGGIVCVNNTDGFSGAGMLRITSDGSGNSLSMYRGVKVAGTEVNFVQLYLNNSVDAPQAYAAIGAGIVDPTDGAESGFLKFYTWKAGTFTVGVQIGQPTEGQLAVTGSIFANASQTDTVFAGNRSLDHGNIVGSDGYWAIRSSTANAICFDVYNGGAPITPLTILQNGNLYMVGDCSALTFTDRTPVFEGEAIRAITGIKSKDGMIDHESIPEFMQSTYQEPVYVEYEELNDKGEIETKKKLDKYIEKIGRNLGNTISILLKAIQEQQVMIEELQVKENNVRLSRRKTGNRTS